MGVYLTREMVGTEAANTLLTLTGGGGEWLPYLLGWAGVFPSPSP